MSSDKFLAAMEYTLTFAFAAENNNAVNVTVKASVESDSDTLPFTGLKIPAGAIVNEKNQYIVTLVNIDEGPKAPEEEEGKVTSITVTGIPTEYDAAQTYDVKVTGTNLNGDKTVIGDWTVNGTTATLTITAEPMADCTFADKVVVTPTPASQTVENDKITITYEVKDSSSGTVGEVRAKYVGGTFKLYAYNNGNDITGTTDRPMTDEEVIQAIKDYDGSGKAVTLTKTNGAVSGVVIGDKSFTITAGSAGSAAQPEVLYKVTYGSKTEYISKTDGGTFEGLDSDVDWLLSKAVSSGVTGTGAVPVADGKATFAARAISADTEYVKALAVADTASVGTATTSFEVQYKDLSKSGDAAWTALTTGKTMYVAEGVELRVSGTSGGLASNSTNDKKIGEVLEVSMNNTKVGESALAKANNKINADVALGTLVAVAPTEGAPRTVTITAKITYEVRLNGVAIGTERYAEDETPTLGANTTVGADSDRKSVV